MRKFFLLSALFCLLLTGCDGQEKSSAGTDEKPGAEQEVLPAGELSPGKPLSVKAVQTMHFEEPEEGYVSGRECYRIMGSQIYLLRVEKGDNTARLCVQIYDVEKNETVQHVFSPRIEGHEDCFIFSADLTEDRELSLKMRDVGEEEGFYLVKTDLEGNVQEAAQPFPDELYPWNLDPWEDVKAFGLCDGRIVLSRYDAGEQSSALTWYREEDGEETPLGTLRDDFINGLLADDEDVLYYLGGNSLVRWDVKSDIREELFQLNENGVEPGAEASGLIQNEQGDILLCRIRQGKGTIYVLTAKEEAEKEQIRLASLLGEAGTDYFRRRAATFTQDGGEVPISLELESRQAYQEDYRNRVMAEMAAGKGPDILFVTQEDMILMQQKGMLWNLSDMIPQETRDVLIPGVLELGTVKGQLVGLVTEAHFETMGTPFQVWGEAGWNLEELSGALEARDDWECPLNQVGVRPDGYSLLYTLLFLSDSSVLDLEQGICRLDSQEFVRILELCKKYGDETPYEKKLEELLDRDERSRLLREGEMAAEILHFYGGLGEYSSARERLGEHSHIVGFPVESGSGNYVDTYSSGYLVVNARTQYREEIGKFFSLLLDYDNQFMTSGSCVRMDVIRDCVTYDEWRKCYFELHSSDPENRQYGAELATKPDGATYLEDFLAFVESCEPLPYTPPQIKQIVREESDPFFAGRKEAEEVADIIQRRVRLYLEEMK